MVLQAEQLTKWKLFSLKMTISAILILFCVFSQLVTTFIFFWAWDKSRVKWDNSRNSTQKMRTYVCSFRIISTHCVTFSDCCCDDLWHRSGAGPAPDWRLRRRQHWAGGLHGGPVSPTGVVWGNDACDKASSEAGHSGAHYVLGQGTLCPPKADPRLLDLYPRPRGRS